MLLKIMLHSYTDMGLIDNTSCETCGKHNAFAHGTHDCATSTLLRVRRDRDDEFKSHTGAIYDARAELAAIQCTDGWTGSAKGKEDSYANKTHSFSQSGMI